MPKILDLIRSPSCRSRHEALLIITFVALAVTACTAINIKRPNPFLNTSGGRDRMARLCEAQLATRLPPGAVRRTERGRFENDDAYGTAVYAFNADLAGEGRTRFVCLGEEDGSVSVTLY